MVQLLFGQRVLQLRVLHIDQTNFVGPLIGDAPATSSAGVVVHVHVLVSARCAPEGADPAGP